SEPAKELLRKMTGDSRVYVRANAVVALADAAPDEPQTLTLLRQRAEKDSESRVRGAAVYALVTVRGADPKELLAFFKARRPKEKDPKVAELLSAAITSFEGTLEDPLDWPLTVFCGDSRLRDSASL